MSQDEFRLVIRSDGTIDPECIEQAGLRWVKNWLARRLSGEDPFSPLDRRVDEDPEALVVALLRDAGLKHPASSIISRTVLYLLDRSAEKAPDVPPYFGATLRLCQQVRLPDAGAWFAQELALLAKAPAKTEERWGGYETTKAIVYAAAVQSPGLPSAASRKSWLALLNIPRYSTLALAGLCCSFQDRVDHLRLWWQKCPADQRPLELDQMIFTGLKTEGEATVMAALAASGASFPSGLKSAVNSALQSNGARTLFRNATTGLQSREALWGAISNAAQRPDLVLAGAPV